MTASLTKRQSQALDAIVKSICAASGVSLDDILGRSRGGAIVAARIEAYRACHAAGAEWADIARYFGRGRARDIKDTVLGNNSTYNRDPKPILTDRELVLRRAAGKTYRDIAQDFGVSAVAVWKRDPSRVVALDRTDAVARAELDDANTKYLAALMSDRPHGFLGHWSYKPGGYLYGRAA